MGKSGPVGESALLLGHSESPCQKVSDTFKPCTDVASNLLAIDLRLNVQIAPDGLQMKFQNAEYFTCNPLIPQQFFIQFSTINLGFLELF